MQRKKITSIPSKRRRLYNGKLRWCWVKKVKNGGVKITLVHPKSKYNNIFAHPKVLTKTIRQTKAKTNRNIHKDKQQKALPPGKRRSKSGRIYTETRTNRSDKSKKRRL